WCRRQRRQSVAGPCLCYTPREWRRSWRPWPPRRGICVSCCGFLLCVELLRAGNKRGRGLKSETGADDADDAVVVRVSDVLAEVGAHASALRDVVDRLCDVLGSAEEVEPREQLLGQLSARLAREVLRKVDVRPRVVLDHGLSLRAREEQQDGGDDPSAIPAALAGDDDGAGRICQHAQDLGDVGGGGLEHDAVVVTERRDALDEVAQRVARLSHLDVYLQ